ncbi:hypothetical protein CGLO_08712 [Colletotrichum gloeosporioides Cg-14]|uniref:Uncharacterized protein n=1 Tax=Colletotrichum gloeosporioides (strain Cg-14) TaxID=1237896 RepID=T0KFI0_COLGC|nr:hypothetical protein CGLO_08712 [Colletotrichum gloeosporioides Cg-14]
MSSSSQHHLKPVDIRNASIEELQDGADRIDNYLATMGPSHTDRATILNAKCMVYYVKWKKFREPQDVAEAVQAGLAAAAALLPNDASKGSVFSNQAVSLKGHFQYSNHVEDLDDAIKYGRLVLTCFAQGSHQWKTTNANLCDMICERSCFYRTKEAPDEACEFLEQSSTPGVLTESYESSRLAFLLAVLVYRFETTGCIKTLSEV